MRNVKLNIPCSKPEQEARVARLTRHLEARLLDFGPGGPEVLETCPDRGFVATRFPGHEVEAVLERLENQGIQVAQEGERAVFYLTAQVPFEDLVYVWGCLFDVLA